MSDEDEPGRYTDPNMTPEVMDERLKELGEQIRHYERVQVELKSHMEKPKVCKFCGDEPSKFRDDMCMRCHGVYVKGFHDGMDKEQDRVMARLKTLLFSDLSALLGPD